MTHCIPLHCIAHTKIFPAMGTKLQHVLNKCIDTYNTRLNFQQCKMAITLQLSPIGLLLFIHATMLVCL